MLKDDRSNLEKPSKLLSAINYKNKKGESLLGFLFDVFKEENIDKNDFIYLVKEFRTLGAEEPEGEFLQPSLPKINITKLDSCPNNKKASVLLLKALYELYDVAEDKYEEIIKGFLETNNKEGNFKLKLDEAKEEGNQVEEKQLLNILYNKNQEMTIPQVVEAIKEKGNTQDRLFTENGESYSWLPKKVLAHIFF